jgi:hypothetical protein
MSGFVAESGNVRGWWRRAATTAPDAREVGRLAVTILPELFLDKHL